MANFKEEVLKLLEEDKAALVRHRKHQIYRLSSGKIFVLPTSGSDWRGWANSYSDLRKKLGHTRPAKPEEQPKEQEKEYRKPEVINKDLLEDHVAPRLSEYQQVDFATKLGLALAKSKGTLTEAMPTQPVHRQRKEYVRQAGPVKQIPPHVIKAANIIYALEGEEARQQYLKMYWELDRIPKKLKKEDEEESEEQQEGDLNMDFTQLVEQAKQQRENLKQDIDIAKKVIEEKTTEIKVKSDMLAKADTAIEQLQIAEMSFQDIAPLMAIAKMRGEKAASKSAKNKLGRPRGGVMRRLGNIPGVSIVAREIVAIAAEHPEQSFNGREMMELLKLRPGFENIDMRATWSAMGYEAKKKYSALRRVSEGRYQFLKRFEEAETQEQREKEVA